MSTPARARVVKTRQEVVEKTVEETVENAVTFIKNIHTGEILKFSDGTQFRFPKSKYVTNDDKEIEELVKLAEADGNPHRIFIEEPEAKPE